MPHTDGPYLDGAIAALRMMGATLRDVAAAAREDHAIADETLGEALAAAAEALHAVADKHGDPAMAAAAFMCAADLLDGMADRYRDEAAAAGAPGVS